MSTTIKISKYSLMLVFMLLAGGYAQDNQLSPEEEFAKYDLLFNGVDLDNWHGYRSQNVPDSWTVKKDAPLGPRIQNGSGTKLPILTNQKYKNFDFKIEVKVTPTGNSGIFSRYLEEATSPGNSRTGPETQICGPGNSDCKTPDHSFGACYEMFVVRPEVADTWSKGPDVWNEVRIIAYDSNYVHYGNGIRLLDYKIGTPEFIKAYNGSKYSSDGNNGMYYDIHAGGMLLQHHGETGMAFRNIRIKELTTHPLTQEFADGKWPDLLPQSFVMGKRGCTDPDALNFDPTAEANDSTCVSEPIIGVNMLANSNNLKVQTIYLGNHVTVISAPFKHSNVLMYDLKGNKVVFNSLGNGQYSISKKDISGIVFAKFIIGHTSITRKFTIQ